LILARRWRESLRQQLLDRINGTAGFHTIWTVRFTHLKLTMRLTVVSLQIYGTFLCE